jgi:hypothetical protein
MPRLPWHSDQESEVVSGWDRDLESPFPDVIVADVALWPWNATLPRASAQNTSVIGTGRVDATVDEKAKKVGSQSTRNAEVDMCPNFLLPVRHCCLSASLIIISWANITSPPVCS